MKHFAVSAFAVWVLFVVFLVVPPPGYGDIYRYIDANGVTHFTDCPTHGRYRLFMKSKRSHPPKSPGASVNLTNLTKHYDGLVKQYASAYNLDEALVHAVIKVESNYNSNALSSKGAQGLMQLIPETASDMNVLNPFNPEENIRGGSRYLRLMLDQFNGNTDLALAAYNAGPNAVLRYQGIPPYEETRNYVQKVKKYFEYFRQSRSASL
ncbi:transglycosylase SLT domain-containing protein [Trichloromonas sp.]|uniref:transglycosylase SLT domain-containing protein n=1 Tax=Trichloromonas sp. TaxID=3069249 RepID=UPI002A4BE510|nr:lytic transglycosylase domain-containing protein [Trichloromonas sp.]